jgi:hypothetical protein
MPTRTLARLTVWATRTSLTLFIIYSQCCAYGPLTTIPAVGSIVGYCLTYAAAYGCSMAMYQGVGHGPWTVDQGGGYNGYNGYNGYSTYNSNNCYPYTNLQGFDIGSGWKAARAFSVLASLSGFGTWLLIMFLCCLNFGNGRSVFKGAAVMSVITSILTILILVSSVQLQYVCSTRARECFLV